MISPRMCNGLEYDELDYDGRRILFYAVEPVLEIEVFRTGRIIVKILRPLLCEKHGIPYTGGMGSIECIPCNRERAVAEGCECNDTMVAPDGDLCPVCCPDH